MNGGRGRSKGEKEKTSGESLKGEVWCRLVIWWARLLAILFLPDLLVSSKKNLRGRDFRQTIAEVSPDLPDLPDLRYIPVEDLEKDKASQSFEHWRGVWHDTFRGTAYLVPV